MGIMYPVVRSLIKQYKWTERQVLKLFAGPIERKAIEIAASIGVALHFVEDMEEKVSWTKEEDEALLAKCAATFNRNFSRVIHIKIRNRKEVFVRMANEGSLGFGEAYMNHNWEGCENPDDDLMEFAQRFMDYNLLDLYMNKWNWFLNYLENYWANMQTRTMSKDVAILHYDLGNDLYEKMLDPYLQYTCGYWPNAKNLNEAQEHKLELIAQKLQLKPGMTLLDVGCGWGGLCQYMAERHGVHCVGVTISEEQAQYARERCKGLTVEIRVQDYRDVKEKFDRMTVVGMLEHVGFRNYEEFFTIAEKNLKEDSIFIVHMIGLNHHSMPRAEPWILTYIFPNSNLPYPASLAKHLDKRFVIEDWHNFGADYALTLAAWRENFIKSWPQLQSKYGDRFYRMWIYYLCLCEGIFRARKAQLWQVVLTKDGHRGGYRAPR